MPSHKSSIIAFPRPAKSKSSAKVAKNVPNASNTSNSVVPNSLQSVFAKNVIIASAMPCAKSVKLVFSTAPFIN